jgi:hypothetical protein
MATKQNKEERARRRARCVAAGAERILSLRSGDAVVIEEMRGAVLRGDCPLCGDSGFKSIAGHCQIMHGIRSRELRDLLGITYTESICAPELHDKLSEINADKVPSLLGKPDNAKRSLSKRGRENIVESARRWSKNVPAAVKAAAGRIGGSKNKGKVPWNKTVEHGSRAMFRQGCRCEQCDAANMAYWRNLNERRRQPSNARVQPLP